MKKRVNFRGSFEIHDIYMGEIKMPVIRVRVRQGRFFFNVRQ